MKSICITTALLACLVFSSCTSSSGFAELTNDELRAQIESRLTLMANAMQQEDVLLASQPISPLFVMDNNVAVRYRNAGWEGSGVGSFRSFFDRVFEINANIAQGFNVTSFERSGSVISLEVTSTFSSLRVDNTPASPVIAETSDLMTFEYTGDGLLLLRWVEDVPAQ